MMTLFPNKQNFLSKQEKNTSLFGENIEEPSQKRKKLLQIIASERTSLIKDSKDLLYLDFLLGKVESLLPNGEDPRGLKSEIFGYVLGRWLARQKVPYGIVSFGSFFQIKNHGVFVIEALQSVIVTNVDPEKRFGILTQIVEELIDDPLIEENTKEIIRLGANSGMILSLSEPETQKALRITQDTKESFLRFHNDIFNKCFDIENYPSFTRLEDLVSIDTSKASAELLKLESIYTNEDPFEDEEEQKKERKDVNAEIRKKLNFDLFRENIGQRDFPQKTVRGVELRRTVAEYDIEPLSLILSFLEKKRSSLPQELVQKMLFEIFNKTLTLQYTRRELAEKGFFVPPLATVFEFGQQIILIVEQAFFVLVVNVEPSEIHILRDLSTHIKQTETLSKDTKNVFQLCYEEGDIFTLSAEAFS